MREMVLALIATLVISGMVAKSEADSDNCKVPPKSGPTGDAKSGFVDIDVVEPKKKPDDNEFIDTSVPKVCIYVDNQPIGQTPITGHEIRIPPAAKTREIKVKAAVAGYSEAEKTVTIQPNEVVRISFKLLPSVGAVTKVATFIVGQDHGTVLVLIDKDLGSNLGGAEVDKEKQTEIYIGESKIGTGSMRISNLAVGRPLLIVKNKKLPKDLSCLFSLRKEETVIISADLNGIKIVKVIPAENRRQGPRTYKDEARQCEKGP